MELDNSPRDTVASSPGHSQIYLAAVKKNREKAWDHCYVTDWKWWTRLVQTESTSNRVHHFRSVAKDTLDSLTYAISSTSYTS